MEHLVPQSLRIQRKGVIAEDNPSFTRLFKPWQILFGKRRCYQKKSAVADFEGICSGDIIVMEAIPGKIIPFLESSYIIKHLNGIKTISAQPNISLTQVGNFILPVPPLDEQIGIVDMINQAGSIQLWLEKKSSNNSLLSQKIFKKFWGGV